MLPNPLCPLIALKVAGLQATVLLLLTMLIKARIRIQAFSALGLFLLLLQSLIVLVAGGTISVVAAAAVAYGLQQRRAATA